MDKDGNEELGNRTRKTIRGDMKSKQCVLRLGNTIKTCWIPEKFAVKGKYLKIKNCEDAWIDGWLVESVGAVEDYAIVCSRANSHKKMKDITDI
ncbi:MAG: hypothetical protein GF411_02820 [Candidatus Lokiarchaeota archaeon]|nr:hypothetical protein [Candidatus Lokiarchaeota archaeon]